MAGDVVENVGFGEVVHAVDRPDCNGGGELPPAQAVEEQEPRHVTADRFGLEAGEGLQASVDIGETRDAVGGKIEGFYAPQKMIVGVSVPPRLDSLVEALPGFVVFLGIKLVGLVNVKVAAGAGFLYKRGVPSGEPGSRGRPRHFSSTLPQISSTDNLLKVVLS
jgi:hypothetical protein